MKPAVGEECRRASTLLLLVDSRLPTGGHTHSGGIEVAVADGRVHDVTTLASYLEGRLASTGYVDAALTSATVREISTISVLNSEAVARVPLRPFGTPVSCKPVGSCALRAGFGLLKSSMP